MRVLDHASKGLPGSIGGPACVGEKATRIRERNVKCAARKDTAHRGGTVKAASIADLSVDIVKTGLPAKTTVETNGMPQIAIAINADHMQVFSQCRTAYFRETQRPWNLAEEALPGPICFTNCMVESVISSVESQEM